MPHPLPRTAPGPRMSEPDYQLTELDNGLLVATFPMPWLHEVGVTLYVRAGSRFEEARESGAAHFLEHMLFKGTRRIPDPEALHAHIESLAADMNAATGQESNAYWLSLPPEALREGLLTFCEMFTQPVLGGIDMERKVILSEMREDENEQGEMTNPTVLAGERLWPGHPLARPILGTRESLAELDQAALRGYLERHYQATNMALCFCGPVDHQQATGLAREALGALPRGTRCATHAPAAMPTGPHLVAVNDQTSQFHLGLHYRAPGYRGGGYLPVAALRRLLDDGFSSRLQATVREREGLVYDVWGSYTTHSDSGYLELGASVSPDNLKAVFSALQREIRRLRTAPPEAAEWQRLVTRWRAHLTTSLDRPGDLMDRYVCDRLFDVLEPLTLTWSRVQKLDPATLPGVAEALFQPENLVLVLIGPDARRRIKPLERQLAEG